MQLSVPTIVCEGCADTITKVIQSLDAEASVQVDVATKVVQIETNADESAIRAAIVAKGHTVS